MAFDIRNLKQNTRDITVTYTPKEGGKEHTITATYTPQGYNAALEEQIAEASNEQNRLARLYARMCADLLVSWDVVQPVLDEDGNPVPLRDAKGRPVLGEDGSPEVETEPYPTTYKALSVLSFEFLDAVVAAIFTDLRPAKEAKKTSAAG